jgi:hypothetical protein
LAFRLPLPTAGPIPAAIVEPITFGDVTVTDASPLPTTKAQCRNGGWRNFPDFQSHRQCVAFVRHQARLACIFEREAGGRPAFREKYGRGNRHRHAMRRCIKQRIDG